MSTRKEKYNVTVKKEGQVWQVNVVQQPLTQSTELSIRDVEIKDEPDYELEHINPDCTIGSSAETDVLLDVPIESQPGGAPMPSHTRIESHGDKVDANSRNRKKERKEDVVKADVNKKRVTDKAKSQSSVQTDGTDMFDLMKRPSGKSRGLVHHGKQMQFVFSCISCEAQFLATVTSEAKIAQTWTEQPPWIECSSCQKVQRCKVIQQFTGRSGTKAYRHLPKPKIVCLATECQNKNFVYNTTAAYFDHWNAVHDKEPHECEECGVVCKNVYRYKKHVASVHKRQETLCVFCGRTFQNVMKLKRHTLAVHTTTPSSKAQSLNCDICNKKLANCWTLTKHMRTHQDKEHRPRHTCQICDRSFLSEAAIKEHTLAHSQKYQCSHCSKLLTTKAGLAYHERRHAKQELTATPLVI